MAAQSLPSNLELEQFQWDETSPVVFPDTEAVMEQPDSPPPPPTLPELPPWQELQKKVDLQVQKAAEAAREHLWGHLFAHLPCSEIDWSLDGGRAVCRVVDMPCYGKFFSDPSDMKKHLLSKRHCAHEARLALEWVGPAPSQTSTAPVSRRPGRGSGGGKRKAAIDNGESELEEPSSKKQKKVATSS
ncbi:hypothetical protein IWW34DRAFT_844839 [Fusarium oxysporum f. sp. albedinis]|nr:uncharacterized protein FOBCDRAFT_275304 [Fusarium oxysporum Fo47]KAH7478829.1 hypothetical protein FOMA001_g10136 [Fusarium oxysporum f. sp. matthiolae]KAI3583145.1 hypothetical protein IWW34DRAFT_844839 [Fusarium oxysporum f. sp. albedinis]QKD55698.1 hypothetical protein FOBCDRAFT_275304 [Fusarium oxysporum Fo47]